jgi:putative transposase
MRPAQAGKKEGACPGPWPISWARDPVRLIGSTGHRNDIAFEHELHRPRRHIADKSYDADHLLRQDRGGRKRGRHPAKARPHRSTPAMTPTSTKERNIIERFFNKLKQFRRGDPTGALL